MAEPSFVVSSNRPVAGIAPGGVVTLQELGDANIGALVAGGHLTVQKPSKSTSTNPEE